MTKLRMGESEVSALPSKIKRNRRTDIERLCDAIETEPNQQALRRVLLEKLPWDQEKLDRVIERAFADPSSAVTPVRGGRSVRFRGAEQFGGRGGVGLYRDVETVIKKYWGPRRHFRDCEFEDAAVGTQRNGHQWVHPDLVLRCHQGSKAKPDQLKRVHTFEIETAKGFGIKSVYQAFEQGRGADYSWVMFHRCGADRDRPNHSDWDRILTAASGLRLGLVGFANSNSAATWVTYLEPRRRTDTDTAAEGYSFHPPTSDKRYGTAIQRLVE